MIRSTLTLDEMSQQSWDAVVIGAGPAGSLVAQQLAIGGAKVLLVEKQAFPREKVCGACLNGQALAALDSAGLGDLVDAGEGIKLDRFCVRLNRRELTLKLPQGRAISRSKFDLLLAEAAIQAGAHYGAEVKAIVGPVKSTSRTVSLDHRQTSSSVEAKIVIVAGGLANRCIVGPEIETRIDPRSRIGTGCSVDCFPDAYSTGTIFMAVGGEGYVGLVRVEGDKLNVAAAFSRSALKSHGGPGLLASMILKNAGFPPITSLSEAEWRGTLALTRQTIPLALPRLFLIGDAAGYVEPFTGEGMGWALSSAIAILPLLRHGIAGWNDGLASEWTRMHAQIVGKRQRLCRFLALSLRYPAPARMVLEAAGRIPLLSGRLIRHLNAVSLQTSAS